MRIVKLSVSIIVAFVVASCAGQYETVLRSTDYDLKYKKAFEYFNNGKYRKSAELFESLVLVMQGLPQEDTVKYYNALSNYEYGDYVTAESNFANFIEVFPRSPFTEKASYLRIKCLYGATYRYELDQTPTYRAMTIINEFLYDNPDSKYAEECRDMIKDFQERLDRKSFAAAKIYYDMEDYKAANFALKNVLKDNAENQYREQVLYYTALASYKYALNSVLEKQYERYLSFIDDYYNYVGEFPDTKAREELDAYYAKVYDITQRRKETDPSRNITVMSKKEKKAFMKEENARAKAVAKELKKAENLRKEAEKLAKTEKKPVITEKNK